MSPAVHYPNPFGFQYCVVPQ